LFNDLFTIARKSRSSDGQGGWTESFANIGTEPGRIRPASAREREAARRLESEVTHVMYVRPGANVKRGDRATGRIGTQFELLDVRRPSQGHHLECDCREVQGG
jgi:head-tail adaptor